MKIDGNTELIAHIGYPTFTFKSPMIYNPFFEKKGINALVVPMACKAEHYPVFLKSVFQLENIRGALITMPHKVITTGLLDEVTATVKVAGACNAVKRTSDGRLVGDMFDGAGFVRGIQRKGFNTLQKSALVIGSGGVGSAIAASLAGSGIARIGLYDVHQASAEALATRIHDNYPEVSVVTGSNQPEGYDLVVNATPMGMNDGDPMPVDVNRIAPDTFVGEVVMKSEMTAFLQAAKNRGCRVQIGSDMLFEQIPAYLEYFGFPTTTAQELRETAELSY
jgi:shikimate dehydrogenase